MVPRVVGVEARGGYQLRVTFDDGVVTEVDMADDLWGPMFEPLRDETFFRQVGVDEEAQTVVWPNGLDLDPLVLHGDYPPEPPTRLKVRRINPVP